MTEHQGKGEASQKNKRRLKNYLIDRDYQLRYTMYSVVIAAVLCGGLGALVIWQTREATSLYLSQRKTATSTFKNQRQETTKLINKIRKAGNWDVEQLLATATKMVDIQLQSKDALVREVAKKVKLKLDQDDRQRVSRRKKETQRLARFRQQADRALVAQRIEHDKIAVNQRKAKELILIIAIVVFGIIFLVILFLFFIVITHKVAGPLYKMGRYIDDVREGRLHTVYNLRKGDQLAGFYNRFKLMHEALKEREQADIKAMESVLAICENQQASGVAVEELKARLDAKRSSVD